MYRALLVLIFLVIGCKGFTNSKECLTLAIYHEAKNQSMLGQIAVGQVVLNRVKSKYFPNNVCDVVKQGQTYKNGKMVLHKCQFSFWCDGKKDEVDPSNKQWIIASDYADIVLSGNIVFDITEGAEFYHAYYVRPAWLKEKKRTVRIDSHIFYRWTFKKY